MFKKINRFSAILTFVLAITGIFNSLSAMDLTGRSIVVGENASKVELFAAEELQVHLKEISGKELKIIKDSAEVADGFISIGKNKLSEKLQIDYEALYPEGFIIATKDDNLFILGSDNDAGNIEPFGFHPRNAHKGTIFGVYDFLEKYFGLRWYWPGNDGRILKKQSGLIIPDNININEKSPFLWRHQFFVDTGKTEISKRTECLKWYMRMKMGIGIGSPFSFSHSWFNHIKHNKYFKDHPEYYSEIKGKRLDFKKNPNGSLRHTHTQVCTSNPEVVELFARSLTKGKDPEKYYLSSISPNDGACFCECKNCLALDRQNLYKEEDGYDGKVYSDRVFTFVNQVARKVRETHPKMHLGIFAYTFNKTPPRALAKVEPNVVISFTQQLQLYNDKKMKQWNWNRLNEWLSKGNKVVLRDYLSLYNYGDTMRVSTDFVVDDILNAAKNPQQIIGMYSESAMGDLIVNHLTHYLTFKLLWNPKQSKEKIMGEYYREMFGSSVNHMKVFTEILEAAFQRRKTGSVMYVEAIDLWLTEDVSEKCLAALESAGSEENSDAVRHRISTISKLFNYNVKLRNFIRSAKVMVDAGIPIRVKDYSSNAGKHEKQNLKVALINGAKAYEELEQTVNDLAADKDLIFNPYGFHILNKRHRWKENIAEYSKMFLAGNRETVALPLEWSFSIDPDNKGMKEGWQSKTFNSDKWQKLRVDQTWEKQGFGKKKYGRTEGYNGFAWYRLGGVKVDKKLFKEKCILMLGAVDESCTVYVNGKNVGSFTYDGMKEPDGWKMPREFDITGVIDVDGENSISVQVEDKSGAGGIWRKAYLIYESEKKAESAVVIFQENFDSEMWQNNASHIKSSGLQNPAMRTEDGVLNVKVTEPDKSYFAASWANIDVVPGKIYVFEIKFKYSNVKANEEKRERWQKYPALPLIRIIPYGEDRKPSVKVKDYIWAREPFKKGSKDWTTLKRAFAAPDGTVKLNMTVYFHAAGDYQIGNILLKEIK
ncbi:MAG: DUF4838 domain-containing protein [Planctomycetota bacterium]|jgi:hypothetical protein